MNGTPEISYKNIPGKGHMRVTGRPGPPWQEPGGTPDKEHITCLPYHTTHVHKMSS